MQIHIKKSQMKASMKSWCNLDLNFNHLLITKDL
jgi:hypothetical protein